VKCRRPGTRRVHGNKCISFHRWRLRHTLDDLQRRCNQGICLARRQHSIIHEILKLVHEPVQLVQCRAVTAVLDASSNVRQLPPQRVCLAGVQGARLLQRVHHGHQIGKGSQRLGIGHADLTGAHGRGHVTRTHGRLLDTRGAGQRQRQKDEAEVALHGDLRGLGRGE
jgi:hypothetical protein